MLFTSFSGSLVSRIPGAVHSYIPATEDINIAIMPFQTADNGLIIVCQNSRIIRRKERIPGSSCEWKDVTLAPKSRNRVQL
ncbi:PilI type IV pilus biogenesis protein [Escherichia coli]|nr:PilI type IV pilus biogenesis protein [Shigella sonnei]EKI9100752.1 PilI type IV pilus biogenesis protein [Escherichia coli]EKJ3653921.1 PilI type IV pilus biogenesis protein [Escherichia coli]ELX9001029.1 PilI type IV pilus biogenesis protein [Shigella sonnei]